MKRESLVGEEIEITILSLGFSLFFGFGGRCFNGKKEWKERESRLRSTWFFCLALFPPRLAYWRENFLIPFLSLGAPWSPDSSRKTLLFVNLPCNYYNFFLINYVSLMKIYLKLQLNLSHQIKLFFSKNWIILSKCLTRQYHWEKNS